MASSILIEHYYFIFLTANKLLRIDDLYKSFPMMVKFNDVNHLVL